MIRIEIILQLLKISSNFIGIVTECGSNQIQCGNGVCLGEGIQCDSINNCGDRNDETSPCGIYTCLYK